MVLQTAPNLRHNSVWYVVLCILDTAKGQRKSCWTVIYQLWPPLPVHVTWEFPLQPRISLCADWGILHRSKYQFLGWLLFKKVGSHGNSFRFFRENSLKNGIQQAMCIWDQKITGFVTIFHVLRGLNTVWFVERHGVDLNVLTVEERHFMHLFAPEWRYWYMRFRTGLMEFVDAWMHLLLRYQR